MPDVCLLSIFFVVDGFGAVEPVYVGSFQLETDDSVNILSPITNLSSCSGTTANVVVYELEDLFI